MKLALLLFFALWATLLGTVWDCFHTLLGMDLGLSFAPVPQEGEQSIAYIIKLDIFGLAL